jgi:hypothetical protein
MDGVGMDAWTGIRDEVCQAVLEGRVRLSRPGGPPWAQETPVGSLRGCCGVLAEVSS